jgi:outer membrane protein
MVPAPAHAAVPAVKKIAMVDMQRVLNETKQGKKARKNLESSTTTKQIRKRIDELQRQADALAASGRYLDAIDRLNELKQISTDDEEIQKKAEQQIAKLQRRMNYSEVYRSGVTEYFNKNYQAAMQYFEQALRLDPKNEQVKEYYRKAEARANAREEPFKNSAIQNKYKHAVYLYFQKKYKQALKILNEIQKEQPYNKLILKLIDDVEDALRNR